MSARNVDSNVALYHFLYPCVKSSRNFFEKIFKKALYKLEHLCYNCINVKKGAVYEADRKQ